MRRLSRRTRFAVAGAALILFAAGASGAQLMDPRGGQSDQAAGSDAAAPADDPEPGQPPEQSLLLPNIRSLPADGVYVSRESGRRQLRFAGRLANLGPGPLELVPEDPGPCPADQRHAQQVIYHDVDGDLTFDRDVDTRRTVRPAGCMLDHPAHNHWHFDATARYSLHRPGETAAIVSEDKVSFCLRDSRRLSGFDLPRRYGDCARDRVQGISAGWVDLYRSSLPGQALELPPGLPDGVYCLHIAADPLDLIQESREDDNASVSALRIAGADVQAADQQNCPPP
jgi:hypothetical protein